MSEGKVGAPVGNVNAVKHGKYSSRDFLTCAVCVAKKKCPKFLEENQMRVCVYEKKLEKPDLSTIFKLIDFLRELLAADWLRFQRAVAFERLSGGMLDGDALKLEGHMRGVAFTIAKLSELSEIEKQIQSLDERTREILILLAEREAKETKLVEQITALEAKIA
jgi:hypothetical protein